MANRSLRLLATLLVFTTGCSAIVNMGASETALLQARVWGVIQVAMHEPGIVPDGGDDLQPGDRCPCNDTSKPGKSGDGLSICTMCNGTLVIVTTTHSPPAKDGLPAGAPTDLPLAVLIPPIGGDGSTKPDKGLDTEPGGAENTVASDSELAPDCCAAKFEELMLLHTEKQRQEMPVKEKFIKTYLTIVYGDNCPPCERSERDIEAEGPLRDFLEKHFVVLRMKAVGNEKRPKFIIGESSLLGYKSSQHLLTWLKSHINPEGKTK